MTNINTLIHVDKRDKNRVLLTEVLPYEVPMWLSNDHFYKLLKDGNPIVNFLKNCVGSKKTMLIPFLYKIKRSGDGIRELAVMHPLCQLEVLDFYENYHDLILYYCQRSDKSLRAPCDIASRYYVKNEAEENESIVGVETQDRMQNEISSYFVYNKFNFLYKFFESYDYHKMEKRFSKSFQVDVSKCFHHIYTHSICWAVKSKDAAKKNAKKVSFDGSFDRLMQSCNYNETNGIIVGPEVSRIFAEIIFQTIDIELIKRLSLKEIKIGVHFEFRRYVDDYFIFYNDETVKDVLLYELEDILSYYKLHLNESKSLMLHRPFMTEISQCKLGLEKYFNSIFKPFEDNGNFSISRSYNKFSNSMIVEIKNILRQFDIKYSSVSCYMLSIFHKHLKKILIDDNINDLNKIEDLSNLLIIYLDVIFFISSMDIRVRPTDWVAQIIQLILLRCANFNDNLKYLVKKKVFDSIRVIIKNYDVSNGVKFNIEITNMILVLSMLGDDFKVEEDFLRIILNNHSSEKGYYFTWSSLMLYIRDDSKYNNFRRELERGALEYICNDPYGLNSTETYMFFFDFISCPFVGLDNKKSAIVGIKGENGLPATDQGKILKIQMIQRNTYFIDWNDRLWIRKRLKKKQFIFPYE